MHANNFSSLTALKIFNIVNAGTELGLVTPLTTAASVSLFLTRIVFIYLFKLRIKKSVFISFR